MNAHAFPISKAVSPLADLDRFNADMRAGLADKLFFLDKIDVVDTFVDFGCADGSLLAAVAQRRPGVRTVGVDRCPLQRQKAQANGVDRVCSELPAVVAGRSCLILSSVLHEIELDAEFNDAHDEWTYIAIRDMAVDEPTNDNWRRWGSEAGGDVPGETYPDKVEHLLKYRYLDDWEREAGETYLQLFASEWLDTLTRFPDHRLIHFDHHSHPFTRACVERDWGFPFPDRTHFTAILARR